VTQQQRLNRLLELVSDRGNMSIAEIGEALGISAATARRDLSTLAAQRLVTRTHGGAAALGSGYELPLQYKIARQAEAKVAIAKATAGLIAVSDSVGLNGGTTTSEVARELGRLERFVRPDRDFGLTIVTNALNIAYELSVRAHVKIVVTGGVSRRQSYELVGPMVTSSLADMALDVAVLGVDGLTARFGATTLHEGEADVSRQFAAVAKRVVVVADSTKLARSTFARIAPLEVVDVLVTDLPVEADMQRALDAASVEVIVAG
jgi:DeoR family transcriptional regulator of aga operon